MLRFLISALTLTTWPHGHIAVLPVFPLLCARLHSCSRVASGWIWKGLKIISVQRKPDIQAVGGDQKLVNNLKLFFKRFDQTPSPSPNPVISAASSPLPLFTAPFSLLLPFPQALCPRSTWGRPKGCHTFAAESLQISPAWTVLWYRMMISKWCSTNTVQRQWDLICR